MGREIARERGERERREIVYIFEKERNLKI